MGVYIMGKNQFGARGTKHNLSALMALEKLVVMDDVAKGSDPGRRDGFDM